MIVSEEREKFPSMNVARRREKEKKLEEKVEEKEDEEEKK